MPTIGDPVGQEAAAPRATTDTTVSSPISGGSAPFRRLFVDHLIEGGSRVWWELHGRMNEAGPYTFQLQVGHTGNNNATDWTDVGSPQVDAYYAIDDQKRLYGKRLTTHYRVKLTTASSVYVSDPVSVEGWLQESQWLLAREILRKDALLDRYTASEGYLLKRFRYGQRCTRCLDTLTEEVTDSKCPECRGVGFKVGYHPPVPMCIAMENQTIQEARNGTQAPGQTQYNTVIAHVSAFPQLALEDVWVDAKTDLRFAIETIRHTASLTGVPLLSDITMHQLPFTDVVYRIGVGGEANDHPLDQLPTAGEGSVEVTHDYGGEDALAYILADGCGVGGATILAFTEAAYDAGARLAADAVAATVTAANGRWSFALQLDPGDYVLVYSLVGRYGPDVLRLEITDPEVTSSSISEVSDSSGSDDEFGPF